MTRPLAALGCALAACASGPSPVPAWYTSAAADNPAYPRSRYLIGVGLSTASAGDGDARAKEAVASQISARLESETSSFQQYTTRGGTSESVTSRVSVRTSFDRADLIRIAERARGRDWFYALAVLDRAATDRELAAAMSADLASFEAAARSALASRAAGESGVFATAASDAMKLRPRIDAAFIVRRAIAGRAPEEAGYVVLRDQLLALVEEARARRVVGVVVKDPPNTHLTDFTLGAVKHLGLRPDAAGCAARDRNELADAAELDVTPEETCGEGSLGERCEVRVRIVAVACSGGTSGTATVGAVRGIHPSDREKARKSAWDKVTAQAVEAAVREALEGTIQIGE